jgi:hypothetical protein
MATPMTNPISTPQASQETAMDFPPGTNPGLGKSMPISSPPAAPELVAEIVAAANAGDANAAPGEFAEGPIRYTEKPVHISEPARLPIEGAVHTAARRGPPPLKLLAKLAAIMADLNWVEKRGRNVHFNYDYATESDILAAIRPRLAEAGIFVQTIVEAESATPTGKESQNGAKMMRHRVQLLHIFYDSASGESLEGVGIGYSNDDSDKGFYKAYTGAVKYFFAKTFLVSSGDDPENEGPEERAAKKAARAKQEPAAGQAAGPQRSGGNSLPPEGTTFTVDGPVGAFERAKTKDHKPRYIFHLTGVGKASTIDIKLAEGLIKEKESGMRFRWKLVRAGSFLNLQGVDPILPDGA